MSLCLYEMGEMVRFDYFCCDRIFHACSLPVTDFSHTGTTIIITSVVYGGGIGRITTFDASHERTRKWTVFDYRFLVQSYLMCNIGGLFGSGGVSQGSPRPPLLYSDAMRNAPGSSCVYEHSSAAASIHEKCMYPMLPIANWSICVRNNDRRMEITGLPVAFMVATNK